MNALQYAYDWAKIVAPTFPEIPGNRSEKKMVRIKTVQGTRRKYNFCVESLSELRHKCSEQIGLDLPLTFLKSERLGVLNLMTKNTYYYVISFTVVFQYDVLIYQFNSLHKFVFVNIICKYMHSLTLTLVVSSLL